MQNTEDYTLDCSCYVFCRALGYQSNELLSKADDEAQWKQFEHFLKECLRNEVQEEDECSLEICSGLVHKLDEFRSRDIHFPTFLVELITILNYKKCAKSEVHWIWEFDRPVSLSKELEISRVTAAFNWPYNEHFMKLLLNYGFLRSLPADSVHLMKILDWELTYFIGHMERFRFPNMKSIKEEAFRMVKDIFFRYDGKENWRRMFLALRAINIICVRLIPVENKWPDLSMTVLRMYFAGTRDALLSTFEVRSVLYTGLLLTNKLHLFDRYCQEFEVLMPESPAKLEPRKLTHLALCQVRDNLSASNLPLPSAVEKLPVGKTLKSFLLGEVGYITRNRGNVSLQKCVTQSELASLLSERSQS